jgi:hypothetical protein
LAQQLVQEAEREGGSVAPFIWNPPMEVGLGFASRRFGPMFAPDTGQGVDMLDMLLNQLGVLWHVPLIHWPTLIFASAGSAYAFLRKADKTLKSYLTLMTPKGIKIETTKDGLRFELHGVDDIEKAAEHFKEVAADPDVQRMHKRASSKHQMAPKKAAAASAKKKAAPPRKKKGAN